jgi:hypothetical protein
MAAPLKTAKQSVNLASSGAPGSRIRRDPPPKVKEIVVRDPEERDRRDVLIGILVFTLALFVIMLAFSAWSGWTPRSYTVEV